MGDEDIIGIAVGVFILLLFVLMIINEIVKTIVSIFTSGIVLLFFIVVIGGAGLLYLNRNEPIIRTNRRTLKCRKCGTFSPSYVKYCDLCGNSLGNYRQVAKIYQKNRNFDVRLPKNVVLKGKTISNKILEYTISADETTVELIDQNFIQLDLSPLSQCNNLRRLILGGNLLTFIDLSPLASCTKLQEVYIYRTLLRYIDLSPLTNCTELRYFSLSFNRLWKIDLSPLAACRRLQTLSVTKNNLEYLDLSPLTSCKQITYLYLNRNPLLEVDLTPLIESSDLQELQVDRSLKLEINEKHKYQPLPPALERIRTRICWKRTEETSTTTFFEPRLGIYKEDRIVKIPQILEMNTNKFDDFFMYVLKDLGWKVKKVRGRGGKTSRLIARKESTKIGIIVSRAKKKLGKKYLLETIDDAWIEDCETMLVITVSKFKEDIWDLAKERKVNLWDGDMFARYIINLQEGKPLEAAFNHQPFSVDPIDTGTYVSKLLEGKPIFKEDLEKELNLKDLTLPGRIKEKLREDNDKRLVILSNGYYRLILSPPPEVCTLCQNKLDSKTYYQCLSCKKYYCEDDYKNLGLVGRQICQECNGILRQFPFSCIGCKVDFSSLADLGNGKNCPICGHPYSEVMNND